MWRDKKALIDFDKAKGLLVNGKPAETWFVGGSGDLYAEGNKPLITAAALKAIIRKWIEQARI